ncbi:MAG TPA: PAP/fibrillin family protein [Crinalium sp.]|jgi:hypothetical protein
MITLQTAKAELRSALETYEGNPKHEAVATLIEQLAQRNPTTAPTRNEALRDGEWLLISAPSFPGGERLEDGRYRYTLGRLAFNLFQPADLKLVIDRVLQPVLPIADSHKRSHDIIVEFAIADDRYPPLQGIVHNSGVCEPLTDDLLQVQFTGGSLEPQATTDREIWQRVFGNQSPSAKRGLKDRVTNLIFNLMFGLVPPQHMDQQTGRIAFEMTRSPKGKLEILYLDEELRITRGEKGTILICERCY